MRARKDARVASTAPSAGLVPNDAAHGDAAYRLRVRDGTTAVVYSKPRKGRSSGLLRQGEVVPAKPVHGSGCDAQWYEISGGGYVCAEGGLEVADASESFSPLPEDVAARAPRLESAVPYRYAKVTGDNPPRLERLPRSRDELEKLRDAVATGDDDKLPKDLVERWLDGTYLVAIARRVKHLQTEFVQTSDGNFLMAEDLTVKVKPRMVGEVLDGADDLPIAFVPEQADLHCRTEEGVRECGVAHAWSRAPVEQTEKIGGVDYVVLADDTMLRRDEVRIAAEIERPEDVPESARWVHVDLSDQALVAYEGDEPRYATLISSGLAGEETETEPGTWQIYRSYVTKTMRGRDDAGRYEVQEVPWAMYYHRKFAVHGAYWHEEFGNTRSHGCVNVPPVDARWLFYWLEAQPPRGWHETYSQPDGAWVHITGETPQSDKSDHG